MFEDIAQSSTKGPGDATAVRHLLAHVLCEERHTVTGLLRTAGRQAYDWSGDYRLYASQLDPSGLFVPIVKGAEAMRAPGRPLVVAVDDSTFRRGSRTIPGAGWHRDPLSPAFHTNLVHGVKFVQLSAAVATEDGKDLVRMLPIGFRLIPKLPKAPKELSEQERLAYQQAKNENAPGAHALVLVNQLREELRAGQSEAVPIWLIGDGHYTTHTVVQGLPDNVVYIGRTRGDLHLCAAPEPAGRRRRGRPASYGEKLPTPDELRKDLGHPWQETTVRKNGKNLVVRYKQLPRVKWASAGEHRVLQLIVVAPLRYKKRKNDTWRYTKPAYLLCTDPDVPAQQVIQAYMWRWDIEVHFKEEKQLFGLAHAQVRNPNSVAAAPALAIAAYAGLHLAALRAFGPRTLPPAVQLPKWRNPKPPRRLATSDLLRQLRYEAAVSLLNFSGFSFETAFQQPPRKRPNPSIADPSIC